MRALQEVRDQFGTRFESAGVAAENFLFAACGLMINLIIAVDLGTEGAPGRRNLLLQQPAIPADADANVPLDRHAVRTRQRLQSGSRQRLRRAPACVAAKCAHAAILRDQVCALRWQATPMR